MFKLRLFEGESSGSMLGLLDGRSGGRVFLLVADFEAHRKILLVGWSKLVCQFVLVLNLQRTDILSFFFVSS